MFQKIRVFSYLDCIRNVANYQGNNKIAIISMQDSCGFGFQFIPGRNVVDVLTIYCDDVDTDSRTICTQQSNDFDRLSKNLKAFSSEDAQRIVEFINKNKDSVDELWVHCFAGQSRSQGAAAAISKYFFNDDERYFRVATPNRRVYRYILEAFFSQDNQ